MGKQWVKQQKGGELLKGHRELKRREGVARGLVVTLLVITLGWFIDAGCGTRLARG
jgi:hypothetical protein